MTARLLGVLFLVLTGCSDKAVVSEKPEAIEKPGRAVAPRPPQRIVPEVTNQVAKAEFFPGATPEERAHIRACLDALDDRRESLAMRHAREFMDSTNAEVRLQAVEAFGWIGKYAIRELAEMMADADEEVGSEALRQWEMAFDEYSNEAVKMQELERAATLLKKQEQLESVMMKVVDLEDYNAVKLLSGIITSGKSSPIATEVARAEYASLTGEPFVDERRANQLVALLRNHAEGTVPQSSQTPPKKDFNRKGTK